MDLLNHIKIERAQKKIKQPFRSTLFNRINSLVKKYSLGESFLKRLDNLGDCGACSERREESLAPSLLRLRLATAFAPRNDAGDGLSLRAEGEAISNFPGQLPGEELTFDHGRQKEHFEPSLFSLSPEEEYRVTIAIMNKVNNPYLHFVNSPDEILLCEPLFRRNPSLGPDKLARYHFETLLINELTNVAPELVSGDNVPDKLGRYREGFERRENTESE